MPFGKSQDPLVILPGPSKPQVPLSLIHSPTSPAIPLPLPKMQFKASHCIHEPCPLEGCPHTNPWLDGPLSIPVEMQHPSIADFCLPIPLPSSLHPDLDPLLPSGPPGTTCGYSQSSLYVTEEPEETDRNIEMEEILIRLEIDKKEEMEGHDDDSEGPAELPASQQTVRNEPTVTCEIPPEERRRHMYRPRAEAIAKPVSEPLDPSSQTSIRIVSWIDSSSSSQQDSGAPLVVIQQPTPPAKDTAPKKTKSGSLRVQTDITTSRADALDNSGNPLPREIDESLAAAKEVIASYPPTPLSSLTPYNGAPTQAPGSTSGTMQTDTALKIVLEAKSVVKPDPKAPKYIPPNRQTSQRPPTPYSAQSGISDTSAPFAYRASGQRPTTIPAAQPKIASLGSPGQTSSGPMGFRPPAKVPIPSTSKAFFTAIPKPATIPTPANRSKSTSSPAVSVTSTGRSIQAKSSHSTLPHGMVTAPSNGTLPPAFDQPRPVTPSRGQAPVELYVATKSGSTPEARHRQKRKPTPYPSPRRTGSESGDDLIEGDQPSANENRASRHDLEEIAAKSETVSVAADEAADASIHTPETERTGPSSKRDVNAKLEQAPHPAVPGQKFELWNEIAERVFDDYPGGARGHLETTEPDTVARGPVHGYQISSAARISIHQLVSADRSKITRDTIPVGDAERHDSDYALYRDSVRHMSDEELRAKLSAFTATKAFKAGFFHERLIETEDDKTAVMRMLELEAEASAKGTPHEYTLNPEVFKRDTLPSANGKRSAMSEGKKRQRAKVEDDDHDPHDQDTPDMPKQSVQARGEATYQDAVSPASPLVPNRKGSRTTTSNKKQKTNAMASSSRGGGDVHIDQSIIQAKGKGKMGRIGTSLSEERVAAAKVMAPGPSLPARGKESNSSRSRTVKSFIHPRPVGAKSADNTSKERARAVRSKKVAPASVKEEKYEHSGPSKKARIDKDASKDHLPSARVKIQLSTLTSAGSLEGQYGDILTDRDAEGSPDPDELNDERYGTPARTTDSFVAGPSERTRSAARPSTRKVDREGQDSTDEDEEGPSTRPTLVRAAQAVGRAKTAKALQMPYQNFLAFEPLDQPGPSTQVQRRPSSSEYVKGYSQAEDDIIRKIVAKHGTHAAAAKACSDALVKAGYPFRTPGALSWRIRYRLDRPATAAD